MFKVENIQRNNKWRGGAAPLITTISCYSALSLLSLYFSFQHQYMIKSKALSLWHELKSIRFQLSFFLIPYSQYYACLNLVVISSSSTRDPFFFHSFLFEMESSFKNFRLGSISGPWSLDAHMLLWELILLQLGTVFCQHPLENCLECFQELN